MTAPKSLVRARVAPWHERFKDGVTGGCQRPEPGETRSSGRLQAEGRVERLTTVLLTHKSSETYTSPRFQTECACARQERKTVRRGTHQSPQVGQRKKQQAVSCLWEVGVGFGFGHRLSNCIQLPSNGLPNASRRMRELLRRSFFQCGNDGFRSRRGKEGRKCQTVIQALPAQQLRLLGHSSSTPTL